MKEVNKKKAWDRLFANKLSAKILMYSALFMMMILINVAVALAQSQYHPLSQVYPMDKNIDLQTYQLNASWVNMTYGYARGNVTIEEQLSVYGGPLYTFGIGIPLSVGDGTNMLGGFFNSSRFGVVSDVQEDAALSEGSAIVGRAINSSGVSFVDANLGHYSNNDGWIAVRAKYRNVSQGNSIEARLASLGAAVYGSSGNNPGTYAGYFQGNTTVTDSLSVGGGSLSALGYSPALSVGDGRPFGIYTNASVYGHVIQLEGGDDADAAFVAERSDGDVGGMFVVNLSEYGLGWSGSHHYYRSGSDYNRVLLGMSDRALFAIADIPGSYAAEFEGNVSVSDNLSVSDSICLGGDCISSWPAGGGGGGTGVNGSGVSGRLAIWNDTDEINSTADLTWDFQNDRLTVNGNLTVAQTLLVDGGSDLFFGGYPVSLGVGDGTNIMGGYFNSTTIGALGEIDDSGGAALMGLVRNATGQYPIEAGIAYKSSAGWVGVYGKHDNATGSGNVGLLGTNNTGVSGFAGNNNGVSYAGYFVNDAIGGGIGVYSSSSSNGYSGIFMGGNVGIGTTSPASNLSVGGPGIVATGIYGEGLLFGVIGNGSSRGVMGLDSDDPNIVGVLAESTFHAGVYGSGYPAVMGKSVNVTSHIGELGGPLFGAHGRLDNNYETSGYLAYNNSDVFYGAYGRAIYSGTDNIGVYGGANNGNYNVGVVGNASSGGSMPTNYNIGVYGTGNDLAGYFEGNVNVTGTLYASNVSSNSPLQLQTKGTTRMYINDTTGNVGIGTTNPSVKLDIEGGGVMANATDSGASYAVAGQYNSSILGVLGFGSGGYAGWFMNSNPSDNTMYGVYGKASGSGTGKRYGIYGNIDTAAYGCGVFGSYNSSVFGCLGNYFQGNTYVAGVRGEFDPDNWGFLGTNDTGVVGTGTKYAGYFIGNVNVTGNISSGTGTVFIDGTNSRIGVGTTSPEVALDVEVTSGGAATIGHSTNAAAGDYSVAMGVSSNASGNYSFAAGYDADATGSFSNSVGRITTASGNYSLAMGTGTTASGIYSTAMGRLITVSGDSSFGIGLNSTSYTLSQSNTMAIMGGNVGIGTTSPSSALSVGGPGVAGTGVYGSGSTYGVYGSSSDAAGTNYGVYGQASSAATNYGVYGKYGSDTYGTLGFGYSSGSEFGVYGFSKNYYGVYGDSTSLYGVFGSGSTGVVGNSSGKGSAVSGAGVYGTGTNYGVYGQHNSSIYGYIGGTDRAGYFFNNKTAEWPDNTYALIVNATANSVAGNPEIYGIYSFAQDKGVAAQTYGVYGRATGSSGRGVAGYGDAGGGADFDALGPGINYAATSSIRWKTNIEPIPNALDKVMNIRGVYFDWDEEHGGQHDIGFIAEEVGEYVPEVVAYEPDSEYATGMDYGAMTPILVEAIKELKNENDALKALVCLDHPEADVCRE